MKMTTQKAFNNTNNVNSKKSFCKVCKDAGKSEQEFTSHFVRSEPGPKGKIVCPTLLVLECKHCFKKGHTISYCKEVSKVAAKEKYNEQQNQNKKFNKNSMEKREKKNVFEYLLEEKEELIITIHFSNTF